MVAKRGLYTLAGIILFAIIAFYGMIKTFDSQESNLVTGNFFVVPGQTTFYVPLIFISLIAIIIIIYVCKRQQ